MAMLTMLAADYLKLSSFVDRLAYIAISSISSQVKRQQLKVVKHQIKESAKHGTLNAVGHNISHLAATAAGLHVSVAVIHLLIKLMASNVGHIGIKFLASAAAKKMMFIIVKEYATTAVTGIVPWRKCLILSIFNWDELLQKIAQDEEFQEMVQGLDKAIGEIG
ncbi:uncharacterized protein PAC_04658 [Phialocephala subalpina]|uniref:Uncharacterized protein n=1 Tax=Phialocephala subalpina TaxID=576137 RepID=A0A1L7WPS2_9HELO|nr:uncharacterized protein PAC_04658 [Phialocephala subalpina]